MGKIISEDYNTGVICEDKMQQVWVKMTKEQEKYYPPNEYTILLTEWGQTRLILCNVLMYHYFDRVDVKYEPIKLKDMPCLE